MTTFDVINPATEQVIDSVPDLGPDDALAMLGRACDAAPDWAATTPRERGEILRRTFEICIERTEELARTMTLEMGKSLAESRTEVAYGAEFVRWFAEEAPRIHGRYMRAPNGPLRLLTTKVPVGPVLAITPWNFPLAMFTRKIAPALAAGCTALLKPAAETPLTARLFVDYLAEAGLPENVVQLLTTSDSGAACGPVIADPRLRKLTFTGSTPVGRKLLAQASERILRTSMELGGNAPFVVLPSADLDRAVEGALAAKTRNIGQACNAANRFYVHGSLAEEFTARLATRMSALTVGDGLEEGTDIGPLINAKARERVLGLVEDAVDRGARVVTGGEALDRAGYFLSPTVLDAVRPGSRVLAEEIFAPVAPVVTYSDTEEALRLANDTPFGLQAFVFGENLSEVLPFAERLEAGMVGVNAGVTSDPAAPFGGVKESGLGREGSFEGIEEYLETRYLGIGV